MKNKVLFAVSAILLAACGDEVTEVTNVYHSGFNVVDSVKDLPKCTGDNEGDQAVVKGETSIRVCIDGNWTTMNSENSGADFSCKTEVDYGEGCLSLGLAPSVERGMEHSDFGRRVCRGAGHKT